MTLHNAGGSQPPRSDELDLSQPITAWMPTRWYPGHVEGMPDLLVGQVPMPPFSRPYKTWLVETPSERSALLSALAKPVPIRNGQTLDFRNGPDATCCRRSRFRPRDVVVSHYAPLEAGWPHIVVAAVPEPTVRDMGPAAILVRERYTVTFLPTEAEAHDFLVQLSSMAGIAGARLGFGYPDRRSAN